MKGALKDLKAAPMVWGAVGLVLVVGQTMLSLFMALWESLKRACTGSCVGTSGDQSFVMTMPLFFLIVMFAFVVLWTVSSALAQRRRQLALLVLQGATPIQLLMRTIVVVAVLFVVANVAAFVIVPLVAQGFYRFYMPIAIDVGSFPPYVGSGVYPALMRGAIFGGATVLVGTIFTMRSIARISPIEALRQSQNPPRRIGVKRMVMVIVLFLAALVVLSISGLALKPVSQATIMAGKAFTDSTSALLIWTAMLGMFLLVFALALAAPLILGRFASWWTSIPIPSATWKLAGQQSSGRINRQRGTVMPLVIGLTMTMTFSSILATFTTTMNYIAPGVKGYKSASLERILAVLAPAIIVALAGVVAGLCISAGARKVDAALTYVAGADIGQLTVLSFLDGAIMSATSVLLAFIVTNVALLSIDFGLLKLVGHCVPNLELLGWLAILVIAVIVGAIATGIQGLTTRYQDSMRIIASAIGE
ncbi:hypothetical protein PT279_05610 [Bifidobacterium sp. ESL0784]|uniref:hypothetical protein n=1 Tax=Bifidobacterium sp. ESL0784 TaxID=2983231 RepID=UPI0023F81321|nr:hypothetical protein [Bifidobacterium sp. ESL0784]MDF7641065.1 hypothetical protein [Bifidobacterium sp. ESL0784]